MRTRKLSRTAAAALLSAFGMALLVWLAVVPATRVQAATFTVNVTTDEHDQTAGDGQCLTAAGKCTLRAAIEEANASGGQNIIAIGVAGPIVLNSPLAAITDNGLVITGSGQQVSMTAPNVAFWVNADGVQFNNLIIDGANVGQTGIAITSTTDNLIVDNVTIRGFTTDGFDASGGAGQGNTIRNSTITANPGDGIFSVGGKNTTIINDVITNNGQAVPDQGLEVSNEDGLLIQGNTFSGNFNAQILVGNMLAGQQMSIIQNTITAGSDGIVIGPGVASLDIHIGLSVDNRNVFRGTITAPAEQYLRNLSVANINAIYNDWNAYTDAGIEGVICHNNEAGCGSGVVSFDPFIGTPSPLPTITPTPTVTSTPGTPTVTPTGTPAATGTPGALEMLPLIAGCNPLAWTGPDNTPIATVAGAVTPAGILVALWEFNNGVWLGYSPQFPEVSDLQAMNRLEVVFVCVSATGTFSRPVI